MSNVRPLLMPSQPVFPVTCLDPRADPADIPAVEFGGATRQPGETP